MDFGVGLVNWALGVCLAVVALDSWRWTWLLVAVSQWQPWAFGGGLGFRSRVLQWQPCTFGGGLGFRWLSCSGSLEVSEVDLVLGGGFAVAVLYFWRSTWFSLAVLQWQP